MPRRPMRWLAVQATVTAAVATIGVATAATRDQPATSVDSVQVFAAAPAAATKAGTVRVRITVKLTVPGGRTVSEVMTGAFDIRSRVGSMTLILPAPMSQVEMVQHGTVVFASVAPSRLSYTQGRHWVSVDSAANNNGTLATQDPLAYLRLLAGAEGSVRRVGDATVDGQPTTHYRAHLSSRAVLARVASAVPPEQAAAAAEAIGPTIPADAWLNAPGQLVQMTVRMTVQGMHMDMTAHYRDYGAPVHVTLPQPSDVLAVDNMAALMPYVIPRAGASP